MDPHNNGNRLIECGVLGEGDGVLLGEEAVLLPDGHGVDVDRVVGVGAVGAVVYAVEVDLLDALSKAAGGAEGDGCALWRESVS